MSPTEQLPLRVSVKGVTNNMLNMLQYFFGNSRNSNCEIVNHELAELTIIDLDGAEGRRLVDEYQEKSPEHPLIILSLHNIEVENAILVPKPLKPEQLIKALDTLKQKIQSSKQLEEAVGKRDVSDSSVDIIVEATGEMLAVETEIPEETEVLRKAKAITPEKTEVIGREAASVVNQATIPSYTRDGQGSIGSAPDINQNDPDQLVSAQYNPAAYFQHHIRQAARKAGKYRRAVLLTMPHGSLVVDSDGKSALLDIKESRLHAFCAMPIYDDTLTMIFIEEAALQKYRANATPVALVQVLWKAAIWASRGRFPIETSLNNKVTFRNWPDISRLLLFPHALRIAALWAEQPCSLIETARTLKIHQRYVFAFYSAGNAIGIAYVRDGDGSENDRGDSGAIKKTRGLSLKSYIKSLVRQEMKTDSDS